MSEWRINKQINISVLLQLVLLAVMIIASWSNIQAKLEVIQCDLRRLLQNQSQVQAKVAKLNDDCIGFEYRIKTIEKQSERGQK